MDAALDTALWDSDMQRQRDNGTTLEPITARMACPAGDARVRSGSADAAMRWRCAWLQLLTPVQASKTAVELSSRVLIPPVNVEHRCSEPSARIHLLLPRLHLPASQQGHAARFLMAGLNAARQCTERTTTASQSHSVGRAHILNAARSTLFVEMRHADTVCTAIGEWRLIARVFRCAAV